MQALDEAIFRAIYAGPHGGALLPLMLALTTIGGGWSMIALAPLLASRRTRPFAASLLGTLLATAALVFGLKMLVRRPRPFSGLDGIVASIAAPGDFSFPSGHAAGSFATAAFLVAWLAFRRSEGARRAYRARFLATAFVLVATAIGIGVSRVYLGVHYPGDVAAGATLGAALGVTGARLHARYANRNRAAAP